MNNAGNQMTPAQRGWIPPQASGLLFGRIGLALGFRMGITDRERLLGKCCVVTMITAQAWPRSSERWHRPKTLAEFIKGRIVGFGLTFPI